MSQSASSQGDARQRTIAREVEVEGIGIHSGASVRARLAPAEPGHGLRFRRVDLEDAPVVPARLDAVRSTKWRTVLGEEPASVASIEHLAAAATALGIDNLEVRLDGPEPPALDGSAAPWCDLLEEAGPVEQAEVARLAAPASPIHLTVGDSRYAVLPGERLRVSVGIEFGHPAIGRQFVSFEASGEAFRRDLAPARTFGLAAWRDELHGQGLALGASPENAVVLEEDDAEPELRFPDEFARHKALDLVGDLALLGERLRAHIVAERPGHEGNVALGKEIRKAVERERRGAGPALDIERILEVMPHRYPFLLVDRILEFEAGRRLVGLKNVTINEPFFRGHFPGHPIMPGVLIVEAMAQAGGLLLMNELGRPEEKVVYFMSLDDVKFRRPVRPGDQLLLEVELLQLRGAICRMRGRALVEGRPVAEATMMARVVDR